ncbi:sigma-70 family RNA polymerase sigma factor [Microbacterium sp. NIBRBAC000506063]|uniref:sigma-70 family RNA polymerase sigma factor n=1 Tax=Microbacterium sp. NIBRBAC000506063 TaxID=2734618 RepID=UPI001BB4A8E6|nr:sigma-70 family RNA polymerase sigma factor [Microbacterium sp. NIBRBAC000506063]QTV79343.1 sigma-70 family RNA polymerase sigma factor [Microbacterium sp. NIBRBAC000506063]
MLRTRSGDAGAFGELWSRHYRSGLTVARSMTSRIDPDDLVQEAYARIFQAIQKGGGPNGSFRAYLFTSIRNTAAGWGRANRESPIDELDVLPDPDTTEQAADDALDRSLTAQAFRSLPSRWQEVLWYTEIEQMKPAAVAPLLGMSAGAVSQLAFRAREGLREAWIQAHLRSAPAGSDCQWTIESLGAYARGNLSTRDHKRLEQHLEECARCMIVAAEAKDVSHRLALVLLPLVLGVTGASAYLAALQGGGTPIVALAAMPPGVVDGAAVTAGSTAGGGSFGGTGGSGAGGSGAAGGGAGAAGGAGAVGAGIGAGAAAGGVLSGAGILVGSAAAAVAIAGVVVAAAIVPGLMNGSATSALAQGDDTSSSSSITAEIGPEDDLEAVPVPLDEEDEQELLPDEEFRSADPDAAPEQDAPGAPPAQDPPFSAAPEQPSTPAPGGTTPQEPSEPEQPGSGTPGEPGEPGEEPGEPGDGEPEPGDGEGQPGDGDEGGEPGDGGDGEPGDGGDGEPGDGGDGEPGDGGDGEPGDGGDGEPGDGGDGEPGDGGDGEPGDGGDGEPGDEEGEEPGPGDGSEEPGPIVPTDPISLGTATTTYGSDGITRVSVPLSGTPGATVNAWIGSGGGVGPSRSTETETVPSSCGRQASRSSATPLPHSSMPTENPDSLVPHECSLSS